jgi:hypothetical protein
LSLAYFHKHTILCCLWFSEPVGYEDLLFISWLFFAVYGFQILLVMEILLLLSCHLSMTLSNPAFSCYWRFNYEAFLYKGGIGIFWYVLNRLRNNCLWLHIGERGSFVEDCTLYTNCWSCIRLANSKISECMQTKGLAQPIIVYGVWLLGCFVSL